MAKKKRCSKVKPKCKDVHHHFRGIHFSVLVILAGVLIFGVGSLVKDKVEFKGDNQKNGDNSAISGVSEADVPEANQVPDFQSMQEGTFRGTLKASYYREPIDDVIVLFASAKLPGLSLIYYSKQHRLVGGSPQMLANNIVLFDGSMHEVAYTFKKGEKQALYYDGKLIAVSDFSFYYDLISGMFTGVPEPFVSTGFENSEFS